MGNPGFAAQLIWVGNDLPPYSLHKIITTMGRNEANDILLDDPKVSSFHSNILFREDGYFLLDMKSRNGTWVNGKRISEHELKDGDVLVFGDLSLEFKNHVLPPKQNAPLSRLSRKIQTMALAEPALQKQTDEIMREVEKHQDQLSALIEIITTLAESHNLAMFREKLQGVIGKLLDCGTLELKTQHESKLKNITRMDGKNGLSDFSLPEKPSEKGVRHYIKVGNNDSGINTILALEPNSDIGWIVFIASGMARKPSEDTLDLLDVLLLFSAIIWRNFTVIDYMYRKETERIVQEKEVLSKQKIDQLEKRNRELDEFLKLQKRRLICADGSPMEHVLTLARKLAKVDLPVLITGETGTGKSYLAELLHQESSRAENGFYVIDCATIPANLIESELFGYEKGAFTGAGSRKIGKIENANGGTIFLDEIGDLPLELQGKLLRIVQEGKFERLGGTETLHVNVRIVAATNYQLESRVEENKFRQDLFFRLNVLPLHLPPLRERDADIPVLAKHFAKKHFGEEDWEFSQDALDVIKTHNWSGNVRELENRLQRAWIFKAGKYVSGADLGLLQDPINTTSMARDQELEEKTLQEYREEYEKTILSRCLRFYNGNITKCAEHLDISRNTCKSMIKKYGLLVRRSEVNVA